MVYIGQSINITKRLKEHKSSLKYGTNRNRHLQRAWDKYGKECFKFEIIEKCNVELLDKREIYWIKYYNSFLKGFNQTKGGSNIGYSKGFIEDGKNKNNNKHRNDANMGKGGLPMVNVINVDNNKIFNSITDAAKYYDVTPTAMNRCVNYKQKSIKGFRFIKYDEYVKHGITKLDKIKKPFKSSKKPKKVINVNTGDIYDSISEASQVARINSGNISSCCHHKRKFAGGYQWEFYKKGMIIKNNKRKSKKKVINIDKGIIYDSTMDACRKTGINYDGIRNACNGNQKIAGGYRWMYYKGE